MAKLEWLCYAKLYKINANLEDPEAKEPLICPQARLNSSFVKYIQPILTLLTLKLRSLSLVHRLCELHHANCTAIIQHFSDQWPLKAIYNTASQSPIHTRSHTDGGVNRAGRQPARQERSGFRGVPCSGTPRHSAIIVHTLLSFNFVAFVQGDDIQRI